MTRYFISVIFFILLTQSNAYKYCNDDNDCAQLPGSSCQGNFCECNDGKVLNTLGTNCISIAIQYVDCVDDNQCTAWINGPAECKDKVCRCKDGFRYSKSECIPAKFVGSTCDTAEDCNNGFFNPNTMICASDKTCQCNEGHYQKETFCRLQVKEGETCVIDLDCPDGLLCTNKKCGANPEILKFSKPDIEPRKMIITPCKETKDCEALEHTFCDIKHQMCLCKPGYTFNKQGNACLLDIGESCTNGSECASKLCSSNICQCQNYWTNGYMNEKCIKPYYDNHCSADGSCQVIFGRNSECRSDCVCREGYKMSNDSICEKDSSGGAGVTCSEQNQGCIKPNTICDTTIGYCVCDEKHRDKNGDCVPILGGECDDQTKCEGLNMICKKKTCQCSDNYVPINSTMCEQVVTNITINDCEVDGQCRKVLGEIGICKDGKCQCPSDYKQEAMSTEKNKYTCLKKRYFGDYCNTPKDCKVMLNGENVQCRNNHCACDYGYKMNKQELRCDHNGAAVIYTSVILIISSIITFIIN